MHSGYSPDWLALAMWYIRNSCLGGLFQVIKEAFNTGSSSDAAIDLVPLYIGCKRKEGCDDEVLRAREHQ